jgi:hypothetical protein
MRKRRSTQTLALSPYGEPSGTRASNPLDQDELSGSTRTSWTGSCAHEGMSSTHIAYRPLEAARTEGEAHVLAVIYRFVLFDSQARRGDQHDLTNESTAEMAKHGPQNTESENTQMTKLTAQGYEMLDSGRYVLEVVEAEPVNEYGPQLKLRLRVAEGEREGFEFTDYPNRGAEDGRLALWRSAPSRLAPWRLAS